MTNTTRQIASSLRSVWKSIPLSQLRQGSKLTIKSSSNLNIPLHIKIQPEWRDDGHLELHQKIPRNSVLNASKEVQMNVTSEVQTNEIGEDHVHVSVKLDGPLLSPSPSAGRDIDRESSTSTPIQGVGFSNPNTADLIGFTGDERPDLYNYKISSREDEHIPSTTENEINEFDDAIKSGSGILVTAKIPEKLSLNIHLAGSEGNISILGKVEGNEHELHTSSGNISLTKLRGESISISTFDGTIHSSKFIEADKLRINSLGGNRVRAKMISARDASFDVIANLEKGTKANYQSQFQKLDEDDSLAVVDISSLYMTGGEGAFIYLDESAGKFPEHSAGVVRVKSNHGHLSVNTVTKKPHHSQAINEFNQTIPTIELGGVNGSYDVNVSYLDIHEGDDTMKHASVKIHVDSLSSDSINTSHSNDGDIQLTVDRKVETDMRLLSSRYLSSFTLDDLLDDCCNVTRSNVTQIDNKITPSSSPVTTSNDSNIHILTNAFERIDPPKRFNCCEYIDGVMKNKSGEKDSRFDAKVKGSQGKIDLSSAATQALGSFTEIKATKSIQPLVVASTKGNITVESLSWIGAITRRYGMENTDTT